MSNFKAGLIVLSFSLRLILVNGVILFLNWSFYGIFVPKHLILSFALVKNQSSYWKAFTSVQNRYDLYTHPFNFFTSVSQVGKATMALGHKVAPHLQKQGTRAITHLTGQKESEATSSVSLWYCYKMLEYKIVSIFSNVCHVLCAIKMVLALLPHRYRTPDNHLLLSLKERMNNRWATHWLLRCWLRSLTHGKACWPLCHKGALQEMKKT